MKIVSKYLNLILALGMLLAACQDKDDLYPIEASAPSDLNLTFTLADDDTGLLTVYPEATGATRFELYFGDVSGETPTEIQAGEKASHVYGEGNYTMRVVAYGLTDLSVETTQEINVSFAPPENLNVDVAIDPTNSAKITVTPTADNATLFEVFFGDVENEEPTNILPGESAEHTYAESGTYVLKVIARSVSATTVEYTDTLDIIKQAAPLVLPIDFESDNINYTFSDFGNVTTQVIDNPDPSGINTSSKVAELVKPANAEVWGGTFLQLPEAMPFTDMSEFKVKTWSPIVGATVRLKVENESNPDVFYELDATTTVANAWEELSWDFSGIDLGQEYHKVVLFFDFGNNGTDATYYFDDILLEGGLPGETLELPLDFESMTLDYAFENFGNVTTTVEANPDPSGLNPSGTVAQSLKPAGAETWGGSFIELPDPIDFGGETSMSFKVWSPKSGIPVRLKLENATNPDVFVELDATTTTANAWEVLTYDFSGQDLTPDFHKVVVFFDFGTGGDGSVYYFDDVAVGTGPTAELLELPIDFESMTLNYAFENFGNVTTTVEGNPDQSGVNTSATVARSSKPVGAETWGGGFLQLPNPIDFSQTSVMSIKVWSPKSGIPVRLKLENATNPDVFVELDVNTTTANAWEVLSWDFSGEDLSRDYHKVVLFFDFGTAGDGSDYYFDDIVLGDGQQAEVLGLPLGFESTTLEYPFENFGNVVTTVVANPDPSGINTSNTVAQSLKAAGAETWGGGFIQLANPIDFSQTSVMSIKVWSPKSGIPVRLKLENATNPDVFVELDVNTTTANAWEVLSWDFSGEDLSQELHKVVLFFDFGTAGDGSTYYFDDVQLSN